MRYSLRAAIALLLASVAVTPAAVAQQPVKPAPAKPGQPAAPAQPAPVTPPTPPRIEINDAMLTPLPPARHMLVGWRDTAALISARSVELQVAVLEVERAEGLSRQALGRALPDITAAGRVTHHFVRTEQVDPRTGVTQSAPATPTAEASLTITQPVLAPRVWHAIGTARRSARTIKLRADDQRRVILGAVADGIVAVVTAERVAEINRVGLRSALERLELMNRRIRLESGTKLDVVRAEQDVALARNEVVGGDESVQAAREALGLALGSKEAYGVPAQFSLGQLERSAREACTTGKPEDRSDVQAARSELEVAERGVTDAKLAYAPTADVSSTAAVSPDPIIGDKHYSWSIQARLTVPIWDGGIRYGEARSARAAVGQSKARLDATRRTASIELTQAMRSVQVAEQLRVLAEKRRDLAKESARLSQVAFDAGSATSFELVEAAQAARQAELNLVVREFDVVKAKITALLASSSCSY
jgi:outer membrane protein TolC